jgi:hypothetical protein
MKQYFTEKWQAITLFFRNLFKITGKNGQRRLMRNPLTGKMEWTEGQEIKDVVPTPPDLKIEMTEPEKEPFNVAKPWESFSAFEPMRGDRFLINFPEIEPYFFSRYTFNGGLSSRKMSNGKTKVREQSTVEIYLPAHINIEDTVMKMKKSKNAGNVSIEILDPTGIPIRTILLKNIKIEHIDVYSQLDYVNEDLLKGYIVFSHDSREFK